MAAYEAVIGLEVHVQLATASKLFCSCPTTFGQPANANVCEVCSGMPGALHPALHRIDRVNPVAPDILRAAQARVAKNHCAVAGRPAK